jgi:tetratricopeptide (TPR) repeat protein
MRRTLTPELILRLYTRVPVAGEPLGAMVRDILETSPKSQDACGHLLHLFREDCAEEITLWDVYLAHYRWAGQQRWKEIQSGWDPNSPLPVAALREAPPPIFWGLVEGICESSRRLAASNPPAAHTLAEVARDLARQAPTEITGTRAREELIALTWATEANAFRVQDEVESARIAMDKAMDQLVSARPPLLGLTPAILSLRISLEFWERDFQQALETVAEALAFAPSRLLRARLLVNRAHILVILRRPDEALESLQQAIPAIDRNEDPRLWYCAAEHQLLILTELERLDEAEALLPEVRRLVAKDATDVDALQVLWVEARLALGRGAHVRAEALYEEVRDGFLNHRLAFSAAVVTLELCRLLLEQGRLEEVKTEAASTLQELHRQKVAPEFISALVLVEQAVLGQRLTLRVLQQARNLLDRRAGR